MKIVIFVDFNSLRLIDLNDIWKVGGGVPVIFNLNLKWSLQKRVISLTSNNGYSKLYA